MRVERTKEGWFTLRDHFDVPMITVSRAELESLYESMKAAMAIEQTISVPIIPQGIHRAAQEAMRKAGER
jgi:hypothetical protein